MPSALPCVAKSAVRTWKKIARKIGMSDADVKAFAPAFEHTAL